MLSFENTEVAFSDKTTSQLKKSYWLFWLVKSPALVKMGSLFVGLFNRLRIPLGWAMKKTVYEHFCGGETLEESALAMNQLADFNIKAVLDYAAEGIESEKEFDEARDRIIDSIEMSRSNENIAFAVFKLTGIAPFALLEKLNASKTLTKKEKKQWTQVKNRADEICRKASQNNLSVMIDAEETWIQDTVDQLVEELMEKYNREKPVVYHTLQLYRIDKLFNLKRIFVTAREKGFVPGFKLVRGAYMEKERKRALKYGYASPIHPDKEATDAAFNEAVRFCLENVEELAVCIGTHNEDSCSLAVDIMAERGIAAHHKHVHFSQLKGMSDHISYNLSAHGYNVSKYLPYGPLKVVIPYLIRRAEENTSVAGQTGRELFLLKKELKRRNELKN